MRREKERQVLVLRLSCVADLQWVLGVSAECRGVFEDVIMEDVRQRRTSPASSASSFPAVRLKQRKTESVNAAAQERKS